MPYLSRKIHLKHLTENQKHIIKTLANESKNVYNESLKLIIKQYENVGTLPNYKALLKKLKESNQLDGLGYGFEAVIKQALTSYKIYIKSKVQSEIYSKKSSKVSTLLYEKPKLINYSNLYSEKFRCVDGNLQFPIPYPLFKKYGALVIELPELYKDLDIKKATIIPNYNHTYFELVIVYKSESQVVFNPDEGYGAIGIDIGVGNFATVVSSKGDSFIVDGKPLKSIIQGYEKYSAKEKKKGKKASKDKLYKIRKRRENQVNDYLNKTVCYIVKHCQNNRIANVVIGYNPNFKKGANMGHVNNQIFVQIPYSRFMEKLKSSCNKHGIKFIRIYEFYTSKASFLDGDAIPDYLTREKLKFSGKRKYRGMYIASDGRCINADINAAANILSKGSILAKSKLVHEDNIQMLRCSGFATPKRINPLKLARYK